MTTTATVFDLVRSSMRIIAEYQAPTGAYVASPNFPEYRFSWLRDGSYIALAMDAAGDHASASAFHRWATAAIRGRRAHIEELIERIDSGEQVTGADMLPTRYTLDGEVEEIIGEAWPNFQLDGYGTWLFALHDHLGGTLTGEHREAVELASRYLVATRGMPCFDYWEEYGDRRHTSTIAAIAAGLRAASRLLDDAGLDAVADELVGELRTICTADGSFVKGPEDARVDGSLVSIATPFGLVPADDPLMIRTVDRIRVELSSPSGGIRRYVGDTYYGGNPWLLLTAWLGWHDSLTGDEAAAERALAWVRTHATGETLPEQLTAEPQAPEFVEEWVKRWGPVADPLLWSHAKLLLLHVRPPAAVWR